MRILAIAVSLSIAGASFAADRNGVFQPKGGPAVEWTVNANRTLVWAGAPYIPRGIRIGCTLDDVRAAKKLGFTDVIVETPVAPTPPNGVYAELDKLGMRYLLAIDSLAPSATGFAVEPQGYRIDDVTREKHIDFPIPGCRTALALLAIKRDATIDWTKRVAVEGGHFVLDVDGGGDLPRVLLVYPLIESTARADYWDQFDSYRDELLSMLKKSVFGPGFRGILNPLGKSVSLLNPEQRFVPSSPYFQDEIRVYLQKEYRNVETAQRSWSMSASDIDSFEQMARLVPLWSGQRGVSQLWDPTNDKLYICNSKYSRAWRDIDTVATATAAKRYRALTAAVQAVANVPIVQEWCGWSAPYGNDGVGVTGLGMVVSGTSVAALDDSAAKPASSATSWATPGWFLASDLRPSVTPSLDVVLDEVTSMGARGWFVRSKDAAILKSAADEAAKGRDDVSAAQWSPKALYFPENATNPAMPQRLPGGTWWLPSPDAGNRIDYGTLYSGYRGEGSKKPFTAIWCRSGSRRVKLRMMNPKNVSFETVDGSDPRPKLSKNGVELNLTEYPLLIYGTDEIPVPEDALDETNLRFTALFDFAEKRKAEVTEEHYFYKDTVAGYDRNPGGSFTMLRQLYRRLNQKLGRLMWLEAERPQSTNFSGPVTVAGCSDGAALSLDVPVATSAESYYATYNVPVLSEEELEVWVAGRIPAEQLAEMRLIVGGQTLRFQGEPVSSYGLGFAWYKFGTTMLKRPSSVVRLEVVPKAGADLAIDAVFLYPGSFRPNGIAMPDGIEFPTVKKR